MKRFEGKVVVVTGASRGIGQAVALGFGREGATVVGVSRNLEETANIFNRENLKFISLPADLETFKRQDAEALISEIVRRTGRLDVLINNAGIIRRYPAVDYPEDEWERVLHINLTVPFLLSQAAAKWWILEGRAKAKLEERLKIVNTASMLSFQGGILIVAYTASKSGLAGITRALANEWAKERINVNAVAPGYISTENTRPLREDPQRNQAILARIPEGRWGNPEDVVGAYLFLASPEADYVNGAVWNVDGGWLAR